MFLVFEQMEWHKIQIEKPLLWLICGNELSLWDYGNKCLFYYNLNIEVELIYSESTLQPQHRVTPRTAREDNLWFKP